jgi:hypothetical protein
MTNVRQIKISALLIPIVTAGATAGWLYWQAGDDLDLVEQVDQTELSIAKEPEP